MTTTYIATLVVRIFAKGTAEATLPLLGQQVVFHREWGDYADPHAVSVWTYGAPHAEMIGYLGGKEAEIVADLIENGRVPVGEVLDVDVAQDEDASPPCQLKLGLTLRGFSGNVL